MMNLVRTSLSSLIIVAGALAPGQAQAATEVRQFVSHAAGTCQGALPAFETAIRKRPLSVQNEGDQVAFVTCSLTSQGSLAGQSPANPIAVDFLLSNTSSTAVEVTCTGVSGGIQEPAIQYLVKQVTVFPAGGAVAFMSWRRNDFPGGPEHFPGGMFSVSCALPPGVGINESRVSFFEEIGTP